MRSTLFIYFALFALFVGAGQSCSKKSESTPSTTGASSKAKGDRSMGLHITEPATGYTDAFNTALRTGFDVVNLHFFWGVGSFVGTLPGTPLETNTSGGCSSASTYDMTHFSSAHSFYPAQNKKVAITIGTYDGPNKFTPACAAAMAFNSATVKTMFGYLLDTIFATINVSPQLELQSLVIGNEIDIHPDLATCSTSPSLSTSWAQYKEFFDHAAAYARTKRPGLKVGVTASLYGLINPAKQPCYAALAANADFISTTYYPLNADFTVKDPSVVDQEIGSLVALFPGKTIYLQEAGYSSGSTYIGSSLAKQSTFYRNLFQTWDKHYDSIKQISFLNLHEWSSASVDGFGALYGLCPGTYCNPFKEYLQTLGLREPAGSGTDKEAFTTIISEAKARGW